MERHWLVLTILSLALTGRLARAQGEGQDRTGGEVAPPQASAASASSSATFSVEPTTAAVIPSTATQTAPPPAAQMPAPHGDFTTPGGPQSPSNPSNPANPGPAGGNMPRDER